MRVQVRLFASLRKYLPAGYAGDTLAVDVRDGATVTDVITALGMAPDHAKMIVSDNQQLELSSPLRDGQEVSLFPPLAGGE